MFKLYLFAITMGLAGSLLLPAQYPGQYPPGQYPPGGYPPGQGPMGGSGIPLPRHGKKKNQEQNAEASLPTIAAEGKTVSNDGKTLVVATEDGRTLTMRLTPETKWTRSGSEIPASKVIPRTTVHIEAAEDDQAYLTATQIEFLKDAPPESEPQTGLRRAPAQEEEPVRPTLLEAPVDAPNRPILRHGAPKQTDTSTDDAEATPAPARKSQPAKSNSTAQAQNDNTDFTIDDKPVPAKTSSSTPDLVARARDWAESFTTALPNFVCEQDTTRYAMMSKASGWEPQDVITAKVIYEDGHEQYREITVGGRKTNKSMMDLGGATSTGEFASVLYGLFAPETQTQFKFYRTDTAGESPAAIYDFKVALANSDWTITIGGQSLRPTYSGSIWIDRSNAHVKRIEKQADNIPKDFPLDEVQTAVDYDQVRLGTGTYLLPVKAEVLSCQRGSSFCTKNTIEFRNYHKFTGESSITFDK